MTEFLTEAWKNAYEAYLENEEKQFNKDLDTLFEELAVAQKESAEALDILQEYYKLVPLMEKDEEEGGHDGAPVGSDRGPARTGERKPPRETKGGEEPKNTQELLTKLFTVLNADRELDKDTFAPTAIWSNTTIKDMKFPENIIFFIGQLIKWIKNVILYFIGKFVNLIRKLTGSDNQMNLKFPTLDLTKTKKIENNIMSTSLTASNKPFSLLKVDSKDLELINRNLREGYILTEGSIFDDIIDSVEDIRGKAEGSPKVNYVVSINFSKDLEDLRALIQHFYDLFDNAYGSNSEKLFDTEDLEIILKLIKEQFANIKNGGAPTTYALGGRAIEVDAVNVYKVRDNLILTNSNITSLKEAYVKTMNKIRDISMIINGKEMLALSQYGVDYKLLTASTVNAMKTIIDSIPPRLKQAKQMEKKLINMKKAYEKFVNKLSETQRSVASISNVTFSTTYQKQISDILQSTRYMSDIVTLRLSALGLYIKELNDTRDLIHALARLNTQK